MSMMDWYDPDMGFRDNARDLWHKLAFPFRRVFWWIIKTIQYSRILWNDYDWDYIYILKILQYKLKRTRERILDNNIILRADEIAAQIKHAEDLIQNWRDDDWCKDLQEAHNKKWGKMTDLSELIEEDGIKMHAWDMSRENATTPELREQENKEQRAIHIKMNEAKKENINELFSHLREYIEGWWD